MDNQQQIQELQAITGLPADQAQMYMEMSGNNLEVAIQMFFDQGDLGGGQQDFNDNNSNNNNNNNSQPNLISGQDLTAEQILWPNPKDLPKSWVIQGITFDEKNPLGLQQHENGPCGPLSVIQAVLISNLLKKQDFSLNKKVEDLEIIETLICILRLSYNEENKYKMCVLKEQNEIGIENIQDEQQLQEFLIKNIEQFKKPMGLILFIYSVIYTKGTNQIRQEVLGSGGELPLVVAPFFICVTDLMMLLLTGKANGNVGDFDPMTMQKVQIENPLQIGVLSSSVHQINIPINDALINPQNNVFILHGGEHFTTMFTLEKDLSKKEIIFYQWNGLKPGGPRMCEFKLISNGDVKTKNPKPEEYKKAHQQYKPEMGEIDSIIQANSDDKKQYPDEYQKWTYEVAITVHEDKDCNYPERPNDIPKPKTYEIGQSPGEGPWRCLACYSKRFKTMCFGLNDAGTTVCQHCQQKQENCGWSIFLKYDELPKGFQHSLTRQHGPKIIGILDTKWKGIQLEFLDSKQAPTI